MNKKHLFSLSLTLIIVMLFSALGPTTVYADDGAPPDTATVEAPQTDGEPAEQTEEASQDQADGDATEEATAEPPADEAVATEEATAEPPADEAAATEEASLMEQLPDNTEIVVINADGETEPLATEEAAAIVAAGDPIWCPDGVAPQAGVDGCSDPDGGNNYDSTSLASLLAYLATWQPDANGTIWIEDSYDSSVNDSTSTGFTFDTTTFDSMKNYNLTIQGGWDGASGSTAIIGTSSFDVPIVIGSEANPWGGSVTIRDIIVSGVQGDTPALAVYSNSNVTIEDSEISDNGSNDGNTVDGKGLEIKSSGYVTLTDITANDNHYFGADIESVGGVAITNSTFNGNLMYIPSEWADVGYYGYGLKVVATQGKIALENVEANGNYLWGATLNGLEVDIRDSKFNENVSGSTAFIDDTGLLVVSSGAVSLTGIEANDNRLIGADINAGGDVSILDSSFSGNSGITEENGDGIETYWGYGLQVTSSATAIDLDPDSPTYLEYFDSYQINLDTVEVNGNFLFGANLTLGTNEGDNPGNADLYINISGSSFSRNTIPGDQSDWGLNNKPVINNIELDLTPQGGLMVQSGGDVALDTVTVTDNGMFGAEIVADGFIDITDSTFSNNVNGSGLSVTSKSSGQMINLTNVIAIGNGLDGAYLETNEGYVCISDSQFITNHRYGVQVVNSTLEVMSSSVFDPNDQGNIFGATGECPSVIVSFSALPNEQETAPYTIIPLTGQLPGELGQGYTLIAAQQVISQATNLAIQLTFPIPAGMENADLVVMFWNGSGWVEVPGGSVVNGEFVITVSQPGIYVLVSR